MSKEQFKQALISIVIGAVVAFFTVLFKGLADFLTANATTLIAGGSSSAYYLTKIKIT